MKPTSNNLNNVSDNLRIRLLTTLLLDLSHHRENKFKYNFQDVVNLICSCSFKAESVCCILLRCRNFTDLGKCFMNELIKIDSCILMLDEKFFATLLLYGDGKYDSKTNKYNMSFYEIHLFWF